MFVVSNQLLHLPDLLAENQSMSCKYVDMSVCLCAETVMRTAGFFQHLSRSRIFFFQQDIHEMLAFQLHTMIVSRKIISVICEEYVPYNVTQ